MYVSEEKKDIVYILICTFSSLDDFHVRVSRNSFQNIRELLYDIKHTNGWNQYHGSINYSIRSCNKKKIKQDLKDKIDVARKYNINERVIRDITISNLKDTVYNKLLDKVNDI